MAASLANLTRRGSVVRVIAEMAVCEPELVPVSLELAGSGAVVKASEVRQP